MRRVRVGSLLFALGAVVFPAASSCMSSAAGSPGSGGNSGGAGGVGGNGGSGRRCSADLSAPGGQNIIPSRSCPRRDAWIGAAPPKSGPPSSPTRSTARCGRTTPTSGAAWLPPGKKIHVQDCAADASRRVTQGPADTGKWVMPVGTVMVKSFASTARLVETRLFVAPRWTDLGGLQLSMERGADRSHARSRRGHGTSTFNTGAQTVAWHYPNRFDCNGCHTPTAGGHSARRHGR